MRMKRLGIVAFIGFWHVLCPNVVEGQCNSFGVNLVNCGTFDCATPTATFSTDYVLVPPGDLYPEFVYTIATNPNLFHAAFWCPCTTANAGNPTGCNCAPADRVCDPTDNWMYVNGRTTPSTIWQQNITGLTIGAYYQFTALVDNLLEGGVDLFDPFLRVLVNGVPLDVDLSIPECPDIPQTWTCGFQATTANITLSIVNLSTAAAGNDFAIDDIALRQCLLAGVALSGCDLAVVLPVEWVAFNAVYNREAQAAALKWEAVGEQNLAYYRIEKMLDNWVQLGTQLARNNNGYQHYEWLDANPSDNNLYRLTPVDLDGTAGVSRIAELRIEDAPPVRIQLIPNPAQRNVWVAGPANVPIQITDTMGRVVARGIAQQCISLEGLAPGLYFVSDGTTAARLLVE